MAKGFLAGVISGGVVSAVGLALVSPMLPKVEMGAAPVAPVEAEAEADAPVADPVAEEVTTEAAETTEATEAPDEYTDTSPEAEASDAATPEEQPEVTEDGAETESAAVPEAAPEPAPEPEVAPDASEPDTNEPEIAEPELAEPEVAEPDPAEPEVTTDQQRGLGTSVAPLEDKAVGVTTNRLPSIGTSNLTPGGDGQGGDDEAGLQTPPSDQSNSPLAIERNAVPAAETQGRPLMAIVLKDMGPERSQLQGLDSLPFPLSVIVDVNAPDLDEALAFYRAAGAELVIQAGLPPAATPTDAEVNFQVHQSKLDQGVAVYMSPDIGFQTNAPLSRQIAEILVASGHGLISQPEGLNTGHKNAVKTGVPAGLIFRELDGAGEDNKVIRRFLDNAAFKADQEDGVILLGRAVPQTMAALIEWSVGNRVSSVAMVPVSAVLLGGS